MINKPREVAKSQMSYQEQAVHKMTVHIDKTINDHLGKYPDEDGAYTIKVSMHKDFTDFDYFFDDLIEHVKAEAEAAGWQFLDMQSKTGYIEVKLQLIADDTELAELEKIREKAKEEHRRIEKMRRANR